jgi:hypothetical protein
LESGRNFPAARFAAICRCWARRLQLSTFVVCILCPAHRSELFGSVSDGRFSGSILRHRLRGRLDLPRLSFFGGVCRTPVGLGPSR